MNRRSFLQGSLSTAGALHASGSAQQEESSTNRRPNILWICTDQQRWDTIHSLGKDRILTPNIDRLVQEGTAFTNTYCQNPVCTPSRSSFLTSCYPSRIHVHRNGNEFFPEEHTKKLLPRILKDAGYDCAMVGKFHLSSSYMRVEPRLDDGYRLFEWSHAPRWEDHWPIEKQRYHYWLRERGGDFRRDYGKQTIPGWPTERMVGRSKPGMETKFHEVTWCAETAMEWMKGTVNAPWFINLNMYAPHPAFDPPREFLEKIDVRAMPSPAFRPEEMRSQLRFAGIDHQTKKPRHPDSYHHKHMIAAYYGQIALIDYQVGRMLETLEETGQRDNTIIVFTSDHGEMLGDHALNFKGCRFYEGAVHVPLIFSWPGRFKEGLRVAGLTELTDIVPTLLEAIGLPVPDYAQGQSLYPALQGRTNPDKHRPFVRCEYFDSLKEPHSSRGNMLRDERYKLVVYHRQPVGELYDLEEDPQEFRNLWDDPDSSRIKQRLVAQLLDDLILKGDIGAPRIGPM